MFRAPLYVYVFHFCAEDITTLAPYSQPCWTTSCVCPWYPLSVDLHPSLLIFTGVSDYSLACHNSRAAYCCADHLLMRVQWEIDLLGNWFVHSDKLYHTLRFATAGRRLVWGIQKTSVHYSGFNSHSLYRITDMKLSNIQVSSFTNSRLVPTVTWEPILGQ